uniref:Uncharacterized protein n=1 Tax=Cucumis sativus TaxID=3659 RepID=A0A0A0LYJ1_CUCSA
MGISEGGLIIGLYENSKDTQDFHSLFQNSRRALEKLKKHGVLTPLRPSPPPDPIPSLNLTLEVMLPKENTEKKQIRGKLTLRVPFLLLKKLGIPLLPQLEEPTATSCRATLFRSQFEPQLQSKAASLPIRVVGSLSASLPHPSLRIG